MKMKILENTYIKHILKQFKFYAFRRKWRKLNKFNETVPMNIFRINTVSVGKYSYGELNVISFAETHKLTIGDYVSIAQNVFFLLDVEHYTNSLSTYPFKVKMLKLSCNEAFGKGDIVVGDGVWIGHGAEILSGVNIGQGAIIAAGSVVTKNVPPYAVVGGVPARVIRFRFSHEIQKEIEKFDYSKLNIDLVKEHIDELYLDISNKTEEEIRKIFWWLPQR